MGGDRIRGNDFKLRAEGRVRLHVRKKFLTVKAVRSGHRLPRETVAVPSLVVSKARLEHPGIVEGAPAHGRGLELDEI